MDSDIRREAVHPDLRSTFISFSESAPIMRLSFLKMSDQSKKVHEVKKQESSTLTCEHRMGDGVVRRRDLCSYYAAHRMNEHITNTFEWGQVSRRGYPDIGPGEK